MKLHVEALELETTHPFVIARGGAQRFENLVLRIEADGLVGEGEGSATHYYGETPAIARLALEKLLDGLADTLSEAVGAGLDLALQRFVAAAQARGLPVTVRDHPTAPHAFDLRDDSAETHAVIDDVLAFVADRLGAAHGS